MKKTIFLLSALIMQIYSFHAAAETKSIESNLTLEIPNAKYEYYRQIKIERVSGFLRKFARPVQGTKYERWVYITLENKSSLHSPPFRVHFILNEPELELYPLSRFVPSFLESEEQQKLQAVELKKFHEFALQETAKLQRLYLYFGCGAKTYDDGIGGGCYNRTKIGGDIGWRQVENPDSLITDALYLDFAAKTRIQDWLIAKWKLLKTLETNKAASGDVERQLQQLDALAIK